MVRKFFSILLISVFVLMEIQPLSTLAATTDNLETDKVTPMVSAGCSFSVVLLPDGTVWSMGVNELSELGNGMVSTSSKPTRVLGLNDIVSVDCAGEYTLALKSDGTVWGWGFNANRGLGNGKPEQCCYAVKITGISDVKQAQAGDGMSVFLKNDGTVWYYNNLGSKASDLKQFKSLKNIVEISFQHMRGIALTKDGHVWTFGFEYTDDATAVNAPEKVIISNVKKVDAGDYHYIVQKKDGSVWLWGNNNHGEIGNGSTDYCYTPTQLKGIKNIKSFATGMYFTMAVLEDGSFYSWGDNQSGQFGNNSRKSSLKPLKISKLKDVIAMDGGYYHTVALKSNGDVVVMGYNHDGVLGIDDNKDKLTPYKVMNITDKAYQTQSSNEIYADGSLADWGKVTPLVKGEASGKSDKLVGIKVIYAKVDDKYLYLAVTVTKGIPQNINFLLDIDGDNKKEYQINFEDKSYPEIYVYKGSKKIFSGKEDVFGVYSDVLEIKIALFGLEDPDAIRIMAVYGTGKDKYGVNTEITSWQEAPSSKKVSSDNSGSSAGKDSSSGSDGA